MNCSTRTGGLAVFQMAAMKKKLFWEFHRDGIVKVWMACIAQTSRVIAALRNINFEVRWHYTLLVVYLKEENIIKFKVRLSLTVTKFFILHWQKLFEIDFRQCFLRTFMLITCRVCSHTILIWCEYLQAYILLVSNMPEVSTVWSPFHTYPTYATYMTENFLSV